MFEIFGYMNAVAGMAVSFILFYVVAAGVLSSSHEGVVLGKNTSSLWTPLRSFLSIGALVPIPGVGVSMAQALLLGGLSLSSYAANEIHGKTIDYMVSHGGQMVVTIPEDFSKNYRDIAFGAIRSQAAQIQLAVDSGGDLSAPLLETVYDAHSDGSGVKRIVFMAPPATGFASLTRPGNLGEIQFECISQSSPLCQKRTQMMQGLVNATFEIAYRIVHHEMNSPVSSAALVNLAKNYSQDFKNYLANIVSQSNPNYQTALNKFAAQAKKEGWITLGAWYWTLAGIQEQFNAAIRNEPSYSGVLWLTLAEAMTDDFDDVLKIIEEYENTVSMEAVLSAAKVHATTDRNVDGSSNSLWTNTKAMFNKLPTAGFTWITDSLTKGDPIANLKSVGDTIIVVTEGVIAGAFAAKVISQTSLPGKALGAFNSVTEKFGSNKTKNAALEMAGGELMKGAKWLAALIGIPLFILGLFFAFYLPALPFILWMSAVAGLMILIVETMVAAPIWFVAHALPEGEGMAGQHGRPCFKLGR